MAIARKNRRSIEVEGREFLWWVYEELEEEAAMTLAVASADKRGRELVRMSTRTVKTKVESQ
jgi:hypothetical protein